MNRILGYGHTFVKYTIVRIRPNSLKTNDEKISNRRQNTH